MICVFGEFTSSYTLRAKEFILDRERSIVEDGYVEMFGMYNVPMRTHLYKVPKLEFDDEDIKIEFDLTVVRGSTPILAAAMCSSNNTQQCFDETTLELVQARNSLFQKAKSSGNGLQLVIDHNEVECAKIEGGCYYAIAVIKQADRCRYKLQVTH